MNKLDRYLKNKLHFWWCIVTVICVIITYCYMKAKATDNYKTILRIASENCNLEVVKFSVKNLLDIDTQIPRLTALHCAAEGECLEVVKFLITEGSDINTPKYERWTALHSAAFSGNLDIVKFLLKSGADPNISDIDGKTPRRVAVIESRHNKQKPYDEIIKLLAEAEDKFQANK